MEGGPVRGHDIPCEQIVEMVTDHLEGAVPAERRRLIEEHLAEYEGCERYVDQIRLTVSLVGQVHESAKAWEALRQAFADLPPA